MGTPRSPIVAPFAAAKFAQFLDRTGGRDAFAAFAIYHQRSGKAPDQLRADYMLQWAL